MAAISYRRNLKRFIISGVPDGSQLETLKLQIRSLGGKVEDNGKNNFMSLCTHVIVRDFNLTEKVLGGLASGKWIVPYKYIIDSHREGRWLDERKYEITDMARKCRLRYLSHGGGIYSGWKIYIKMENITMTKSFRRIVAAGGAEILSHKEISHSDLIIADKKMAVFIRASVGPNIPIVMFTYIKDTVVKGADPCSLSPYLLEGNGIAHLAKKIDLTTPKRTNSYIPKRPQNEVQSYDSKKMCTKVKPDIAKQPLLSAAYQQSKLDQYIQIDSPGRTTPSSSPTKRTPSSSRKRRYLLSQMTPEKQPTISQFFTKKEAASDSDIQCIMESPREKRGLNNNRISECNNDCLVTEVVKSESTTKHKYHIGEGVDDIKREDIKNAIRRRMGLTDLVLSKRTSIRERLEKSSESDIIDLTTCGSENSRVLADVSLDSDVQEIGESVVNSESPVIKTSVPTGSKRQSELFSSTANVYDSEISVCNDIRTDELVTDITRRDSQVCLERVEADVPKRSSSSGSDLPSVPQTIRGDSGIMDGLLKKVTVNIGPRIDEWMFPRSFLGKGKLANSSEAFGQDRGRLMKLSKEVVKKNIGTFIKKSKMVNGIYCGSVAMCSEGMAKEVNGVKKFTGEGLGNGSTELHISPEVRELSVEEISYYESSIDQVLQGVEMFPTEEQSILMTGLDTLYLSITPYTYLPSSLFGDLLRRLVLETEFKEIHSLALNLAHKILSLQPPNNPHWKNYYFETMVAGIQTHEVGSFRAWKFIRSVIESLHIEDKDETMSDAGSNEQSTKMENGLGLLNFLILVLKEDMKNFQRRENACSLLCWKVFWGQSGNPMIVSPPVKQLLRLWVSMQVMSPPVRQCIANLVCIVLELVWKFERSLLLPASPLPTSLAALRTEFLLQIRDISSDQCLKLLHDFSSPWPKMVVSAFIFQEITNIHNQKINLGDIVDYSQTIMLSQESPHRLVPSSPEVSPTTSSKSPLKKIRLSQSINKRNAKGETSLIRACISNKIHRVQELLQVPGIDVNLADHCGWTAMHEAAIRGHTECVKLLLKFNCYDSFGAKNFMYLSCKKERGQIMVNLSAKGGKDGQTPLHDAVMHSNYDTVKVLLDYGGKSLLSEENRLGQTPLDLAKTDKIRKLLESYAKESSSMGPFGNSGRSLHLKATIIASALCKPQGLFPCLDDRFALSIQYVNSYLETSGTRSIHYQIQRNFRHSVADRGVHNGGHPMIADPAEKNGSVGSELEGREGESVRDEASSSSCPISLEAKSEVVLGDEESLAEQLYEGVWMDLKLYNRYKERKQPPLGVPHSLQELVCLFD